MKVGIIGTGFVGLSFAAALASNGYSVLAIDSNKKIVSKIGQGISPFYEPQLSSLLRKALKKSLKVSTDIEKVVNECDLIFITVGTPLADDGSINLNSVKEVTEKIGQTLAASKNRPIIAIKSTVVPNTNYTIKKILEKRSNKKSGKGFGLVSNPEFLREGKAIEDTFNPHIVVIGGEDNKTINGLKKFYEGFYREKIPYIITNPQTAEMIKYANNSFLATKISFINQIANICQSVPGTNVDNIAKAIGIDPRISPLFLKAGPGYGGSCLPKDLQALISFSSKVGQNPTLLKAVQKINSDQVTNLVSFMKKILCSLKNKRITILGLSFKEDSDDVRESVSIKLIKMLLNKGAKIIAHDPMAIKNTKAVFGNKISYSKSLSEALENSDCVVIMTPWKQYGKLNNVDFQVMKNTLIIDTRRMLTKKKLNAKYHAVGLGSV